MAPSRSIRIEVVVNRCFGGFSISQKALDRLRELGCLAALACDDDLPGGFVYGYDPEGLQRDDPLLVQVVRELGPTAEGANAKLVVESWVIGWDIDERDGKEALRSL